MLPADEQATASTHQILDCVEAREPGSIRFTRDPYTEQQIAFHLLNGQYFSLLTCYGPILSRALLRHFERIEDYHHCQGIKAAIQKLNGLCHMNLKTR